MKKNRNNLKMTLFIVSVVFSSFSSVFAYSGGSGTAGDPYQIATKADLLELAAATADYSQYFVLTADNGRPTPTCLRRLGDFLGLPRSIVGLLTMVVLVGMGEHMAEQFLPLYLLAMNRSRMTGFQSKSSTRWRTVSQWP